MNNKTKKKKSPSGTEVKLVVIGAPLVGKSAINVRFVTRRYIGEYDHERDSKYHHEVLLDSEIVGIEVLDLHPVDIHDLPSLETVEWGDGIVFVYSITDRESFNYIRRVKQMLPQLTTPFVLLGNKADMVHLRQVSIEEGHILAKDFECFFAEVSAAEQVDEISDIFLTLTREIIMLRKRAKHSLLDRMLGNTRSTHRAYSRGKSDSALPKD